MENEAKKISQKLRMLRALNGLTQAEVAEKIGITQQSYSILEKKNKIDSDIIAKICNLYGITANELLCMDGNELENVQMRRIEEEKKEQRKNSNESIRLYRCVCGETFDSVALNKCPACGRQVSENTTRSKDGLTKDAFNLEYKYKKYTNEELYTMAQYKIDERIDILTVLAYNRNYLDAMFDLGLYYMSLNEVERGKKLLASAALKGHTKSRFYLQDQGIENIVVKTPSLDLDKVYSIGTNVITNEAINDAYKYVLEIYAETGSGSGFIIEGGFIVTNYHVINGAKNIKCRFDDKANKYGIFKLKVLKTSKDYDIAILKFDEKNEEELVGKNPFKIKATLPSVNEPCYCIGNSLGMGLQLNKGIISAILNTNYGKCKQAIRISFDIFHGNSGGALLSSSNEVLGITTYGITDDGMGAISMVVPSEYLIEVLNS